MRTILKWARSEHCKMVRRMYGDRGGRTKFKDKVMYPATDGCCTTIMCSMPKENLLLTTKNITAMNASKEAILDALRNIQADEEVCIRKLTPRELLRLMGVEDQWIDKMVASGLSKTSLSKLAGNSIVVDNLRYILKPLFVERKAEVKHYEAGYQVTLFDQIEDMKAKGEISND